MAETNFLTYKGKPLVRKDNIIFYGDMAEPFVVKFEILSSKKTKTEIFLALKSIVAELFKLARP